MRNYRGLTKEGKRIFGWYAKRCYAIGSTGPDIVQDIIIELDTLIPYEIIPETVEQYTGRKDKNGLEIYEGDKEVGRKGIQGIVIWLEDECSFAVEYQYPGVEIHESLADSESWFEKVVE